MKIIQKMLLILCAITILISFTGCTVAFDGVIITKYPDRLIYIAGYDTELDLTGGEVVMLLRDMNKRYMETEYMDDWFISKIITHEINFNIPGIYIVKINHSKISDSFAIQVVDADYIDNIINQK